MTAAFLGLEAALYAVFLTMDLTGGSGDPVKYASIAVCLVFSVLFACRGGSRLITRKVREHMSGISGIVILRKSWTGCLLIRTAKKG